MAHSKKKHLLHSPSQVYSLIWKFWPQRARGIKSCCWKKTRKWCLEYRELEKKRCKKLLFFRKRSKYRPPPYAIVSFQAFHLLFLKFVSKTVLVFSVDILLWFFFVCVFLCVRTSGLNWRIVSLSWSSWGLYRKKREPPRTRNLRIVSVVLGVRRSLHARSCRISSIHISVIHIFIFSDSIFILQSRGCPNKRFPQSLDVRLFCVISIFLSFF